MLIHYIEYMDDIFHHDCQWPLMVAVVDLRLDRLLHCRSIHLLDRTNWCNIPYILSSRQSCQLWDLG